MFVMISCLINQAVLWCGLPASVGEATVLIYLPVSACADTHDAGQPSWVAAGKHLAFTFLIFTKYFSQ